MKHTQKLAYSSTCYIEPSTFVCKLSTKLSTHSRLIGRSMNIQALSLTFWYESRARNSKERNSDRNVPVQRTKAYNTRSPVDGERLISNEADLLLSILFRLLLLLPSMMVVPLVIPALIFIFDSWR